MSEPAQKLQIMIVEGSTDVASLLAAHVELNGLKPVKASSAQECLDRIESGAQRIRAAVINGSIALERGGLLVSRIKQADPDIGILVVADEESDRSRLLRLGCEDFAKTPVSVQTIISKLLMIIAKGRLAEDGQN